MTNNTGEAGWARSVPAGILAAPSPIPRRRRQGELAHLASLVGLVLFLALEGATQHLLHVGRRLVARLLGLLLFRFLLFGLIFGRRLILLLLLLLLILLLLLLLVLLRLLLRLVFILGQQLLDPHEIAQGLVLGFNWTRPA